MSFVKNHVASAACFYISQLKAVFYICFNCWVDKMLNYLRQLKNFNKLWVVTILLCFVIATFTSLSPFSNLEHFKQGPDSKVFSSIYERKEWGGDSGTNSRAENTVIYRKLLQKIFSSSRFQSFVDLGYGDFQIMKLIHILANKTYRGIDVVPNIIKKISSFLVFKVPFSST